MQKGMGGPGRGVNMGGTTNTKGFLKSHVEIYHCGSFLKHVHI